MQKWIASHTWFGRNLLSHLVGAAGIRWIRSMCWLGSHKKPSDLAGSSTHGPLKLWLRGPRPQESPLGVELHTPILSGWWF